jgi:hypothetical protein
MTLRNLLLGAAVAGTMIALGFLGHESSLTNARDHIEEAQRKMAAASSAQEKEAARHQSAERDLRSAKERVEELRAKLTVLSTSFSDTFEKERLALEQELRDTILRGRARSLGLDIPSVKLASGTVLTNVRVQRFEGTEVLLSHLTGVQRLKASDLPEPLASRFRVNDPVFKGQDPLLEPRAPSAATPATFAEPAKKDKSSSMLQELYVKRNDILQAIAAASASRDLWSQKARELREKHLISRSSGRISGYSAEATKAEANASAIQLEINKANASLDSVQRQLAETMYKQ